MRRTISALRVELVYDRDCPNVGRARAMIRAALKEVGANAVWAEWDREDAATPSELRSYGSPSVLVNGKDVGCDENEAVRSAANSCRVYLDDCGCVCGAPSAGLIVRAIRRAQAA
jgi:hypothetical protein